MLSASLTSHGRRQEARRSSPSGRASRREPPPAASPRCTHCGSGRRRSPPPSLLPGNFLRLARAGRERGRRLQTPVQPRVLRRGEFRAEFPLFAGRLCPQGWGRGGQAAAGRGRGTAEPLRAVPGLRGWLPTDGAGRRADQPPPPCPVPPLPPHPGRRDGRCGAVTLPAPVPLPRCSPQAARGAGASSTAPGPGGNGPTARTAPAPAPGPRRHRRAGSRGNAALQRPPRGRTAPEPGHARTRGGRHHPLKGGYPRGFAPLGELPAAPRSPACPVGLPPACGDSPRGSSTTAVASTGFPSRSSSLPRAALSRGQLGPCPFPAVLWRITSVLPRRHNYFIAKLHRRNL